MAHLEPVAQCYQGWDYSPYAQLVAKTEFKKALGTKDLFLWSTEQLSSGFAYPNGRITWTKIFSDVSELDLSLIAMMERSLQARQKKKGYEYHSTFGENLIVFNGKAILNKANLLTFAIDQIHAAAAKATQYPWTPRLDNEDIKFLRSLKIVDLGTSEKADYVPLQSICEEILASQGIEKDQYEELAQPDVLVANKHQYIDKLVALNNLVIHEASRTRGEAFKHEIDWLHNEMPTEYLVKVATSAPAILFCRALDSTPSPGRKYLEDIC